MLHSIIQRVVAECGDLALAKECLADLRDANFSGSTQIVRRPIDVSIEYLGSGPYGSVSGAEIARGIAVGSALGLAFSGLILACTPLSMISSPIAAVLVSASVGLGGIVGAFRSFRRLRDVSFDDTAEHSRFLVRCKGEPNELAKAYDVLSNSACHTVTFDEDASAPRAFDALISRVTGEVALMRSNMRN